MSDDLDIRHGGVVVVDTGSLRNAAAAAALIGERAAASADQVQWASGLLAQSAGAVPAGEAADRAARSATQLRVLAGEAEGLGRALTQAANLYEAAELHARWASAAPEDRVGLERSIRALLADSGRAESGLAEYGDASTTELFAPLVALRTAWEAETAAPLGDQFGRAFALLGMLGPASASGGYFFGSVVAGLYRGAVNAAGRQTVRGPLRDAPRETPRETRRAAGPTSPVRVEAGRSVRVVAPTGLAAAVSRIPSGEEGRVRVERYEMPDGSREWVVYIAGTDALGGESAWDMTSNLQLYQGERSASYAAVLTALDDAGRADGEALHLVGHSQGAMIGSHLAASDPATATLVTVGTPVTAPLPETVLSVDLRHRDDAVAALSGPGPALGTGAPESIIVQRTVPDASPLPGVGSAHALTSYVETAQRVDASTDPRVEAQRALWAHLATGTAVATTYAVTRTSADTGTGVAAGLSSSAGGAG